MQSPQSNVRRTSFLRPCDGFSRSVRILTPAEVERRSLPNANSRRLGRIGNSCALRTSHLPVAVRSVSGDQRSDDRISILLRLRVAFRLDVFRRTDCFSQSAGARVVFSSASVVSASVVSASVVSAITSYVEVGRIAAQAREGSVARSRRGRCGHRAIDRCEPPRRQLAERPGARGRFVGRPRDDARRSRRQRHV